MSRPVLVAGMPRTGTTWVGEVLGHTAGALYVHEPDNHLTRPEAWWAKRGLGSYPALGRDDGAPAYERLWAAAFAGTTRPSLRGTGARLLHRCLPHTERARLTGAPPPRLLAGALAALAPRPGRRPSSDPGGAGPRPVVKSVFCARALEWVTGRFDVAVVVVERHPFGTIASFADLGWTHFLSDDPAAAAQCADLFGVEAPPPGAPWLDRAAWHYGFLASLLGRAAARHPEWVTVRHEALCVEPVAGFARLAAGVGLAWDEEAERFLAASNRPGRGYATQRVWSEQLDGGRGRLSPAARARVLEVLAAFPVAVDGAVPAAASVPAAAPLPAPEAVPAGRR